MADTPARPGHHKVRPAAVGRGLWSSVRRLYSLALILVIVWLMVLAVRYLFRSLFRTAPPPPQIVNLPTRLTEDLLKTRRQEWLAVRATEHPRSPVAHYHRLDTWIQPDRFNDCTRSGCHRPLPHTQHKEVRAFLNMHATSLHCGVCHMKSADTPLAMTWYGLDDAKASAPPAALRAYALVMSAEGRQRFARATAADQTELVGLLREAARQADGVQALEQLADHIAAVRSDSDAFRDFVEAARSLLPRHFRGEYGAKLALSDRASKRPIVGHPGTEAAVKEYLESAQHGPLIAAARDSLLGRVHPLRREKPLHCTDCHRQEGSLIDFAGLGYPPARREALFSPPVFQMIENIAAGRPMHLPQFIAPQASQPESPASQRRQP